MNSRIIFLCFLAVGTACAATSSSSSEEVRGGAPNVFSKVLKEYKDILPVEVVEEFQDLSVEEKHNLREIFKNTYKTEKDFIVALREKDPALADRIEKVYERLQKKIEGLPEEPRNFMNTLIDTGRTLYRRYLAGERVEVEKVRMWIEPLFAKYKALSTEYQEKLTSLFPRVTKFLQDEKMKTGISKLWAEEH